MLKLREFSHNHHPGRVKMLAEHIRRGISEGNISCFYELIFEFLIKKGWLEEHPSTGSKK